MSKDDGMDELGNRCLYGCHLVGSWLGSCMGKWQLILVKPRLQKSDPQHDSNLPDDHLKTIDIDYHHLGMSRDDGMDEHGIGWELGCHLVEYCLGSWANDS
jgi:hypothetical protein